VRKLRTQKNAAYYQCESSLGQSLLKELENSKAKGESSQVISPKMIESKRDMINSMFTDRERVLPLTNSKEKILGDAKVKLESMCNTSKVIVDPEVEKDPERKFFANLIEQSFCKWEPKKKEEGAKPQLGAIGILRMRISEKKLYDAEK